LGALVDFLFNGVLIAWAFKLQFKEAFAFIYIPLYFTVALTISNYILTTKWEKLAAATVVIYLAGAALGHFTLVGAHRTLKYSMNWDDHYETEKNMALLRSNDWPQILFVSSERVEDELKRNYVGHPVPVTVDAVTDYGCYRNAAVHTVAGVDVMYDRMADWTWQVNHLAPPAQKYGPGKEDQVYFWCHRPPPIKFLEDTIWIRSWDRPNTATVERQ
jgi:hypothetical protein